MRRTRMGSGRMTKNGSGGMQYWLSLQEGEMAPLIALSHKPSDAGEFQRLGGIGADNSATAIQRQHLSLSSATV